MKRFMQLAGTIFAVVSMHATAAPPSAADAMEGLRISDGTLYRGKERIANHFSISRAEMVLVFIYVPRLGLINLSHRSFPGAKIQGMFIGNELRFDAAGEKFLLTSSSNLLASARDEAWISVDRDFELRNGKAIVAYGDNPHLPYEWPMRVATSK